MTTGFKTSGGEGGIRTLGTGVSPYNGLANGSFSPPSLVFKSLQSDLEPPSRTDGLSFGSYCAPLCAPRVIRFYQGHGYVKIETRAYRVERTSSRAESHPLESSAFHGALLRQPSSENVLRELIESTCAIRLR